MQFNASEKKVLVLKDRKLNIKSLRPGLNSYLEVIVLRVLIEGRQTFF